MRKGQAAGDLRRKRLFKLLQAQERIEWRLFGGGDVPMRKSNAGLYSKGVVTAHPKEERQATRSLGKIV